MSIIGTGRQRYQPVFVDDVAEALLRALDPDVPGGTYALAGPDVLLVDELVSLLNGRAVKERHFAGLIARAVATVAPTLTQAMVGVLSADSLPDVGPAWDTFGITPRSVHDVYNAVGAG